MRIRTALMASCLALPLAGLAAAAHAQAPQPERVIRVPAGSVVLVLPGAAPGFVAQAVPTAPSAVDFPVARMLAEQNAMMQRMMQQMRVLDQLTMPLPDPSQMIQSAMDGMPAFPNVAPGSGVVTTMVSDGHGVCRQTVTYSTSANGGRPIVRVAQSGDACTALHVQRPLGVAQPVPAPRPEVAPAPLPAPAQHHPRLWTVGDPPHPIGRAIPHT